LPFAHVVPPLHPTPHAPQLFESVFSLTHAPAQDVRPPLQFARHLPLEHTSPAGHAVPQVPQWVGSASGSVHTPPHAIWPCGQPQTPPLQDVPPAQTLPHAPQFWESLASDTQAPPQLVRPEPQVAMHLPALHT
jgi:hypothetical protein